jgi:hypothetical protein
VSVGASTYVVDRLTDVDSAGDGDGALFVGDLRHAIVHAQAGDGVTIDVTGTIELSAALPTLTRSVCVRGRGSSLLTVRGAGGTVFSIGPGATVLLAGITIAGGSGNGGGVFNQGTLTLVDAVVAGNTAGDPTNGDGTGGGIWNYVHATLTLSGSTVSGNSVVGNLSYAPSRGGGIANDGRAILKNSTVSGNVASQGFGGGIWNSAATGTLTLEHCTVSGNAAEGARGGGVDNRGVLFARNSIVAGNSDDDFSGDVSSEGYNVFGVTNGGGFDPTDVTDAAPLLGPLQDNGGPTPTMFPLSGSPAIDRVPGTAGVEFLASDQRGVARPQGPMADAGAVEADSQPAAASGIRGADRKGRALARDVTFRGAAAASESRGPIVPIDPDRAPRALDPRGTNNPVEPCATP